MFSDEMMKRLIELQPSKIDDFALESLSFSSCDCSGRCTDDCYDCAHNSRNQW